MPDYILFVIPYIHSDLTCHFLFLPVKRKVEEWAEEWAWGRWAEKSDQIEAEVHFNK